MLNRTQKSEIPWLFLPHTMGELDEYFNKSHEEAVARTAKEVISKLSEEHIHSTDEIVYAFVVDNSRDSLQNMMLKYADIVLRADITIKQIHSKLMKSEMENAELRQRITELEEKKNAQETACHDPGLCYGHRPGYLR